MNLRLIQQLNQSLERLDNQYYKQIYVFEYTNGSTVKIFSEQNSYSFLNINLEISKELRHIPEQKRKFKVSDVLNEIINKQDSSIVCLDFYEILFEPSLQQNPFELFKNISRNKTLIIAWRGTIDRAYFIHAKPGHPEYKKYPIENTLVLN